MKRIVSLGLLLMALASPAWAGLKVFATLPEWGALAQIIGGREVDVFVATHARQDPHHVDARPSLIARARAADLVVANGAELEIGWLPVVLRSAGNAATVPGRPGYFEAAAQVPLLEIPARLDRADGDVHAAGNPHIGLDPRRVLTVGEALTGRMAALDPAHASTYHANWQGFASRWKTAVDGWSAEAAPLKGATIVVHHTAYPYLAEWLGLKRLGALEPKPGVAPTSAHLAGLRAQMAGTPVRAILRPPYTSEAPGQWLAEASGVPVLAVPVAPAEASEQGLRDWYAGIVAQLVKAAP
ncbi:MAG: zinc ABC transporter substrate-binding protein [Rhodocyclaceae bacterium]|nr:zinc ABC transporter substrate-binding protein [Rhodocyclaceae bacterium]MCB1962074.1 zinc ABC transporter substrate-binding protein [Rhodocyclaceae bacterium]